MRKHGGGCLVTDMANEGGVDERCDGVGSEGERSGRGDAEDVHPNPVKPKPPQQTTPRNVVLLPPLRLRLPRSILLLLDHVLDGRLPAASQRVPLRSSAEATAAERHGNMATPWRWG